VSYCLKGAVRATSLVGAQTRGATARYLNLDTPRSNVMSLFSLLLMHSCHSLAPRPPTSKPAPPRALLHPRLTARRIGALLPAAIPLRARALADADLFGPHRLDWRDKVAIGYLAHVKKTRFSGQIGTILAIFVGTPVTCYLCWLLLSRVDKVFKDYDARLRQEEIELYGEYMSADATAVPEVELAPDEPEDEEPGTDSDGGDGDSGDGGDGDLSELLG